MTRLVEGNGSCKDKGIGNTRCGEAGVLPVIVVVQVFDKYIAQLLVFIAILWRRRYFLSARVRLRA